MIVDAITEEIDFHCVIPQEEVKWTMLKCGVHIVRHLRETAFCGQAIEKRSPRQSPVTESQGQGPNIKAVAKEVAADRVADRSNSPPQRGK